MKSKTIWAIVAGLVATALIIEGGIIIHQQKVINERLMSGEMGAISEVEEIQQNEEEAGAHAQRDMEQFFKDMYDNNRFENYEFLKANCTKKLLGKLESAYEYEGGGYAVWLFRTGEQDGPGAMGCKFTSLEKDQDGNWIVNYTDMGIKARSRFILKEDADGSFKIDDVKLLYHDRSW